MKLKSRQILAEIDPNPPEDMLPLSEMRYSLQQVLQWLAVGLDTTYYRVAGMVTLDVMRAARTMMVQRKVRVGIRSPDYPKPGSLSIVDGKLKVRKHV